MGLRISLSCALNQYNCTLYDIHENSLVQAQGFQKKIGQRLIKEERITEEQLSAALASIKYTTDAEEAAQDQDLINESVTEDELIKNKVWQQFGRLCADKTLFTTNTSYMLPSMFASISGRPQHFCAFHFHDVFYANVVDIMPHQGTVPWMIPLLEDLGRSLQQIPVTVHRESSGYLFNNMLMAVIGAAGALVTYEVASIEDVDRSWMGNFKMPIGPFGILDEVGLDTAWHIVKNRKDGRSRKFAALLEEYVQAGKLGQKSGEGFYSYPNPRFKDPDFC
jgi:3-hydroxybutyryl-CoA dehydrogenase